MNLNKEVMTTRQQQIIDSLVSEFNKLQPVMGKGFNLINIQPLMEKNAAIEQVRLEEELSYESWIEAAQIEARRIVELLSDDLPTLEVSVWGAWNDCIQIKKYGRDSITIYVKVKYQEVKNEELNIYTKQYLNLEYSTNQRSDFESDSIEEVLSQPWFLERLRKLI
jgi:hypothetical protein